VVGKVRSKNILHENISYLFLGVTSTALNGFSQDASSQLPMGTWENGVFDYDHLKKSYIPSYIRYWDDQSKVPFLETMFDFVTIYSNIDRLSFDGTSFEHVPLEKSSEVAKSDLMIRYLYNPALDDNRLLFNLVCSRDRFNETIVATIGQRLKHLFEQIFSSNSTDNQINSCLISVTKLNIILPEEAVEIQRNVFCRQSDVVSEGMSIY